MLSFALCGVREQPKRKMLKTVYTDSVIITKEITRKLKPIVFFFYGSVLKCASRLPFSSRAVVHAIGVWKSAFRRNARRVSMSAITDFIFTAADTKRVTVSTAIPTTFTRNDRYRFYFSLWLSSRSKSISGTRVSRDRTVRRHRRRSDSSHVSFSSPFPPSSFPSLPPA